MVSLSHISQHTNSPLTRLTYLVLTPSSTAIICFTIPAVSMASTNRSASPSSEGGYDILTPTASIPDTAKEPSEHDVPNTATGFSAHRKFCRDLVELERWAPIVGSLLDHEMAKMAEMSQFFREKFFTLSRHLPTGTEEQQFESLERLTKLRQGPLAKRMNAISNALLSESILRRVRALGSEVPALDHKVCDHTYQESCLLMSIYVGNRMAFSAPNFRLDPYHRSASC